MNLLQPINVIEIRSFLGLASYYKRFVQDFSCLATPMAKLTKKYVTYKRLVWALILDLPIGAGSYVIFSNASLKGFGCVLLQNGKVIAYTS